MSDAHVFGYGSLVNRRTHGYADVAPARVKGWRRVWQPSPLRRVAYLTAVPDPGSELAGVIARVAAADWPALDQRERAYRRHQVPEGAAEHGVPGARVSLYAVETAAAPNPGQPILLSYLDVVIQGFLAELGAVAAEAFFTSTGGWETPVMDDRAAPFYPRHQRLSGAERAAVDAGLAAVGAEVRPAQDWGPAGIERPPPGRGA